MALKHIGAVPAEVTALATAQNFGPLRLMVSGETSGSLIARLIGAWFLVLFFGSFALLTLVVGILQMQPGALLVALLVATAPAFLLWQALGTGSELRTARHTSYYVFRDGCIIQRDGVNEALSWAEITTLWRRAYRLRNDVVPTRGYRYTLQCADGRRIKLSWRMRAMPRQFATLRQFDDLLVREVTNQRLPEALRALDARQTLDFGPFTVGMGGLTYKQATLLWNEVRHVDIENGVFSIYKVGKRLPWARKQASKIPNFSVFNALVERMARVN
jgi:hypothetical protein